MQTNRSRLYQVVRDGFHRNRLPDTHQQNEGGWNVMAVQPILAALEWQRVAPASRTASDANGAAYEWRKNHQIDFALLVDGLPVALMENKDTQGDSRDDLLSPSLLKKARDVSKLAFGMYSWHKDGGGFGWMPFCGGEMDASREVVLKLNGVRSLSDVDPFAALARPVILGQVESESWLNQEVSDGSPIVPHIDLIDIQSQFFAALCREIQRIYGIPFPVSLQCRKMRDCRPTPTEAYNELPEELLPANWGIACAVWASEDQLKCMFYCGLKSHDKKPEILHYSDAPTPTAIEKFIREQVIPRIESHRRVANSQI